MQIKNFCSLWAVRILLFFICLGGIVLFYSRGTATSLDMSWLVDTSDEDKGSYDTAPQQEREQVGLTGVQVIKSDRTGLRNYEKQFPPLLDAAYKGLLDIVKKELESGADPNMRSFDGGTPIMYAVRNGDDTDELKIFDLLIAYGARARIADIAGYTPLQMVPAVQDLRRRNYYIETLLKHGSRMTEATKLMESSTKVEGQRHGMRVYNVLEIFINNYERIGVVDLLMRWGWLFTRGLRLRARSYAYDMGMRYIAEDMDPYEDVVDSFKGVPISDKPSRVEDVRRALYAYGFAQGLREPELDGDEYTTLLVNGNIPVLMYRGMTPLMLAVLKGSVGRVKLLLEKMQYILPVVSGDKYARTALHMAILQQNYEIVEVLLKAGFAVEARDWQGDTPLHLVASLGNGITQNKLTPLLLTSGANVNSTNSLGDTILHKAVRLRDLGYIEYLIATYSKDIQKNIQNKAGLTAYQLAEKLGLADIMLALKK